MKRVLQVLALLAAAYLLVANLLLNSGLLPSMISAIPEERVVRWKWAVSYWPGRVYVRDFLLRNQQQSVQWDLHIEGAHTQVRLRSLLDKRFETKWVEARGVVFRLRPRLFADENLEEAAAFFPPIEDVSPLPQAVHWVEHRPAVKEKRWSVRLENVAVQEVRELWIGPYRGLGQASVRGRMWMDPGQSLKVGPATLALTHSQVFQGDLLVSPEVKGRLDCTMDVPGFPHLPTLTIVKGMVAQLQLHGVLASVEPFNHHLRDLAHPTLSGGRADFLLDVGLKNGMLVEGTHLAVTGVEAMLALPTHRLRAAWTLNGAVTREGKVLRSQAELALAPLVLEDAQGVTLAKSAGLKLSLRGSELTLGKLPLDGTLSLDLPSTSPFQLRSLNGELALGGGEVWFEGGHATARAHLEVGPGSQLRGGSVVVHAKDAHVRWGQASRVRGDVLFDLDLRRLRLARKSVNLSGSRIVLTNVLAGSARETTRHWSGEFLLPSAELRLAKPMSAVASVQARLLDARPFLALFGDQAGIPRWLSPWLEARGLQVASDLEVNAKRLVVRKLSMHGAKLKLRGQVEIAGKDTSGLFLLDVRGMSVGLRLARGEVESKIFNPQVWFENQLLVWKL